MIYVCGALTAIATSLQRPSREALLPRVVKHQEMPAAVALNSLTCRSVSSLVRRWAAYWSARQA